MNWKKLTAAALCITMSAFLLNACGESSEFQTALDDGDMRSAYTLYREANADGDTGEYDGIVISEIDQMIQELNSAPFDEQIEPGNGYTTVKTYVDQTFGNYFGQNHTIYDIVEIAGEEVKAKYDVFQGLIESKGSYLNGCAYLNAQNPEPIEAIREFGQVLDIDNYYQQTQEKIQTCVDTHMASAVQEADKYFQQGEYEDGQEVLENAREEIASSAGTQVDVAAYIAQSAQNYAAKAEQFFAQGKIEAALQNMEIAAHLAPDNADYQAKLDEYGSYLPLDLSKEDNMLTYELLSFRNRATETANNGEVFKNVMHISGFGQYGDRIANYLLGGKYNKVSGTAFLPQDEKNATSGMFFEIYGDGALLYTSPTLTAGVLPAPFEVDVTGVENLRVQFYAVKGQYSDGSPSIGISEFKASRTDLPQPGTETQPTT